ncbi:unnamed protein product [Cuscuta europaea]|uniref:Uncharacterized protein n=1 Tax=Cuscuta europaea TaxID=41803 RepID=A0A9P0YHB4_CUSEU|nr:unnamed protein product [Cuscuta europaea]
MHYGGGGLCYIDENLQHAAAIGYRQLPPQINYLYEQPPATAQYYMDRRAAMAAMPYMGGGELPPLPPSIYLQVDEFKSIPAVAAAFVGGASNAFSDFGSSGCYYIEEAEDQKEDTSTLLLPAVAGDGDLPLLESSQEELTGVRSLVKQTRRMADYF